MYCHLTSRDGSLQKRYVKQKGALSQAWQINTCGLRVKILIFFVTYVFNNLLVMGHKGSCNMSTFFAKQERVVVHGLLKSLSYISLSIPSRVLKFLRFYWTLCLYKWWWGKGFWSWIDHDAETLTEEPANNLVEVQMIAMLHVSVKRQQESCCRERIRFWL